MWKMHVVYVAVLCKRARLMVYGGTAAPIVINPATMALSGGGTPQQSTTNGNANL